MEPSEAVCYPLVHRQISIMQCLSTKKQQKNKKKQKKTPKKQKKNIYIYIYIKIGNINARYIPRIPRFGGNTEVIHHVLSVLPFKALLECVRLRTFGKFGLQQMQVDAHYLQIYLWRFVSDEQYVTTMYLFHLVPTPTEVV